MPFDQGIESARSSRGSFQFAGRTLRIDDELVGELPQLRFDLFWRHPLAQLSQFAHFQQFKVIAEDGRLLGQVAVDVQHAAVVMAEDADAVLPHHPANFDGLDPFGDLLPCDPVVEIAGHQPVIDAGPTKNASDLRGRTRLAVFEPHAGHRSAVAQGVERRVVEFRHRLQIQHHDRRRDGLRQRQDRGRQGVRRDVQKNQIDARAAETLRGFTRFQRIIDDAAVHNVPAQFLQPAGDYCLIAAEPIEKAGKLRPISIQADAEQADPRAGLGFLAGGNGRDVRWSGSIPAYEKSGTLSDRRNLSGERCHDLRIAG